MKKSFFVEAKSKTMKKYRIPIELKKLNDIFTDAGFEAYLVGGAVRDMILGKEASDWDVTTNATPKDVMKLFKKVIPTGIAHGTVTVHFMKKEIEITTFRGETTYSDGRHPDKIFFAETVEEDLSRRDFTMNAIALNLSDGKLKDPYGGRKDIAKKTIRTVGNPHERFMEDGLRPIRAVRFASQLGFSIDEKTFSEIKEFDVQKRIDSISRERFRDEFIKIIKSQEPSFGIKLLEQTGILNIFIPELAECKGVTQKDSRGFHILDVFEHCLYACDGAPEDNVPVRIAALFHDIGKKDARTECFETDKAGNGPVKIIHFLKHEVYSEEKTHNILQRLKFSNAETEKICLLVREHMFHYESSWSDAAVRRFIVRIGKENIDDLLLLSKADTFGSHRKKIGVKSPAYKNIEELKERIKKIESEACAFSKKDLAVSGRDLIQEGIEPGKKMGFILEELFQTVLSDPEMNTRESLLFIAKKLAER